MPVYKKEIDQNRHFGERWVPLGYTKLWNEKYIFIVILLYNIMNIINIHVYVCVCTCVGSLIYFETRNFHGAMVNSTEKTEPWPAPAFRPGICWSTCCRVCSVLFN